MHTTSRRDFPAGAAVIAAPLGCIVAGKVADRIGRTLVTSVAIAHGCR